MPIVDRRRTVELKIVESTANEEKASPCDACDEPRFAKNSCHHLGWWLQK